MQIWTDVGRIVVELDALDLEVEVVRLEDEHGTLIAAWVDSQDGQPIRIVEPGLV
jgi:hypothetical protein